jgi:hypothetical protein
MVAHTVYDFIALVYISSRSGRLRFSEDTDPPREAL